MSAPVALEKKKGNHSREANKQAFRSYREVKLGCQDAYCPLPDGTHLLAEWMTLG